MFKRTKKLTAVLLSLLMLFSCFPLVSFAANEYDVGNGVVVESYSCDSKGCTFSWTLYENGLMVISGNAECYYDHSTPTKGDVKKVYISDDVEKIMTKTFYPLLSLKNVEEFAVSQNNQSFTAVDGVIYNKDMTEIVAYPQGKTDKTFDIPSTVKEIGPYAFMYSKLTSIFIPKTIKLIWPSAFNGSSLESVTFEDGERNLIISYYSFGNCEKLSSISLHGSRVYAVSAFSFIDTAFYDNESNWENGVLYLNDIILATNPDELSDEYAIKNGTTTIADFAQFRYLKNDGEEKTYDFVYVTIPESVDNIGEVSVYKFNKLPDNLIRFGCFLLYLEFFDPESYEESAVKWLKKIEDIENKYGLESDTTLSSMPIAAQVEMFDQCRIRYSDKYNWIQEAQPGVLSYSGVEFLCEDAVGIGDISDIYTNSSGTYGMNYVALLPVFYDGLILPESFETLSGCTVISGHALGDDELSDLFTEKSVTFLNPNCKIFDDENTLWVGYTICGYKGSTAEAYAKKYNRKFVAIDDCKHETTCRNAVIEATCGKEGYSGDLHCQYCGELLEKGKILDKTNEHNFGEPQVEEYPTCTEWGSAKYTCKDCRYEEIKPYGEPKGHDYGRYTWTTKATCTEDGYTETLCWYCSDLKTTITEPALGHIDDNHNNYCDRCGEKIKDCDCMCHKSGFSYLIYSFIRIFWKLFRTNQICECGAVHY